MKVNKSGAKIGGKNQKSKKVTAILENVGFLMYTYGVTF